MPYVLTKQDIQLLLDLSSAMNCGIALQPNVAARFGNIGIPAAADSSPTQNPSLKWSQAEELRQLALRASGSVFPTVDTGKALAPGATGVRMMMDPNVCYLFTCLGAGNGSASQGDGGVGICGGAFVVPPVPEAVTLEQLPVPGGRTFFPVPVVEGNMLGVMIFGDIAREVLTDIRLA